MDYKKDIFNLIQSAKNNYDIYGLMVGYAYKIDMQSRGEENSKKYNDLSMIQNSINNAGHEERRSDLISKISAIQHEIVEEYEDYFSLKE